MFATQCRILAELRDWEREAHSYWLNSLLAVDEMLSMYADDPERGCVEALREVQDAALQAGQRVRALQERIARLVGPAGHYRLLAASVGQTQRSPNCLAALSWQHVCAGRGQAPSQLRVSN